MLTWPAGAERTGIAGTVGAACKDAGFEGTVERVGGL